ncbi:MAG: N-acetylmuramoyl-L-alanine amidase [Moraxellaceae bacterium]|jgi:N-acetylmuramoyl-L-alanine amidase
MHRSLLLFITMFCLTFVQAQTITILIDPGHGGSDPGHESSNPNHLKEKELNLLIAKKVGTYLNEKLGHVNILYTRTDDTYPTLDQRVAQANSQRVDLFLSIHCNASSNSNTHGTETHVHDMTAVKSVKLATKIEEEFKGKAGRKSRGVKDTDDREYSLQVLKYTQMTGVLVECGFLTNTKEANYLNTLSGQDVLASAIYRGVKNYLIESYPKISFAPTNKTVPPQSGSGESTTAAKGKGGYTIQIMSSKEWLDTEKGDFTKLDKPVVREQVAQTGYKYRYLVGEFKTKTEAQAYIEKVQKSGFKDAIIISR